MPLEGSELRWTLVPRPFSAERETRVTPVGLTLAEMLEASDLPRRYWPYLQVFVNDEEVPRDLWTRVRPKATARLFVRVNPHGMGGGGGKNPFALIASIALIAFAAWAAPIATAALFGTTAAAVSSAGVFTAMGLVKLAVGGAITMVGSLLVNAIAPAPRPAVRAPEGLGLSSLSAPAYAITGVSNRLNAYGAIPRVLGRRRLYPVLAAKPYTETLGNERYMRILLLVGYGPLKIEDLRIGSTPIEAFTGAEFEIREGWENDQPIILYTKSIEEDQLSLALTQSGGWRIVASRVKAREISLDISFDRGLAFYNDQGGRSTATVSFEAEYRRMDSPSWSPITWKTGSDTGFEAAGQVIIADASSSPVRRGGRFDVPEPGQYEIRIRRTTADTTNPRLIDTAVLTALRTITDDPPVTVTGLSLVALRIKAYEQLNNQIQQISCIARSYLEVWDGAAWSWQLSRNPAWSYCDILRRRGRARLIPDSRIDLVGIKAWADACDTTAQDGGPKWTFDGVIEGGSVMEALRDIASHARARYGLRDGKHSVVRDTPQTVPVLHITPRNSFGYTGRKQFIDLPHALKVRFVNPDQDWQEDERIVYADGYWADNAERFETIDLMGCTRPEQAWREGRYHLAVGKLRPESHEVYQDVEVLRATDGDLVMFAHDVILVGLAWGRIKGVVVADGKVVRLALDELVPMEAGMTYALRVRRSDGTSQVVTLKTAIGESREVEPTVLIPEALAPEAGDLFQFGEAGREAAPVLVKSIEPGPNLSAKLTLIPAAPEVHEADAGPIPPFDSFVTRPAQFELGAPPAPEVQAVVSDESALVRGPDGRVSPRIIVHLQPVPSSAAVLPDGIEVRFRSSGSSTSWSAMPAQPADSLLASVQPVDDGVAYDLRLRFVSRIGVPSPWTEVLGHVVVGRTRPPPDVTEFAIAGRRVQWGPVAALDVVGYRLRWNRGNNPDFGTAAPLHLGLVTYSPFELSEDPSGQVTLLIKAVDALGNESLNAAAIITDLGDPPVRLAAARRDLKALGFSGARTNATAEAVTADLMADQDPGAPFYRPDEALMFAPDSSTPMYEAALYRAMSYVEEVVFANVPRDARIIIDAAITGDGTAISYRSAQHVFVNDAAPMWSDDAVLMFRPNTDAWNPWMGALANPVDPIELRVDVAAGPRRGRITKLEAILDAAQIVEALGDIALPAAGARLPVRKTYRAISAVQITLQGGTAARRVEIADKNTVGPLIQAFDQAGTPAAASVDAVVYGY